MTEDTNASRHADMPRHADMLEAYGARLEAWPGEAAGAARRALLADPQFRRAWEDARAFDGMLAAHRAELDAEIAASGALARVRRAALSRIGDPMAAIPWRRVAAAVLLAGMIGGATDFVLPDRDPDGADIVALDALDGLVVAEIQ